MRSIEKIRQLVREQKYVISAHANEVSDDLLTSLDVEQVILTGKIKKRFTRDRRGTRFEIVGSALDGRSVAVVCRMPTPDWLRIITVYMLVKKMKKERCEYCDGLIVKTETLVPFRYRRETIYVDHIPVRRCRKCGEVYYEAEIYKRLEAIAEKSKEIKAKITFPLADYRIA